MEWLNYHHLLYFWMVAREGSVSVAAQRLRLSPSTVSTQISGLERMLGETLFVKRGRGLALTETGRMAFRFADEIFALGSDLLNAVKGRSSKHPRRLVVGLADVVPKLIARSLLKPVDSLKEPVHLICREDKPDRLLAALALHELDVVISDAPVAPGSNVRAFSHLLGESGVGFFGVPRLVGKYRRGFPQSLDGAPVLLPTENTAMRRSLEAWFAARNIRPVVVAEFEDSALLKTFGQDGVGIFPASLAVAKEVTKDRDVRLIGPVEDIRERYYVISTERRLTHPAVLAITQGARVDLFG